MGLLFRGGSRDGDGRFPQVRLQARGRRLSSRILGSGHHLHDGQGARRPHPQSRRHVQPPDQVRRLRCEVRPRLRPHRHGPLCPDGDRCRRQQVALHQSRPREGSDRFPGADLRLGARSTTTTTSAASSASSPATSSSSRQAAASAPTKASGSTPSASARAWASPEAPGSS